MIGVLALQGAFQKHFDCVTKLGFEASLVRTEEELSKCEALILPGGESTAHQKLMSDSFWKALLKFTTSKPTLGTCCGLILMASQVQGHSMRTLGLLDVRVSRNAYGPQIASFEAHVDLELPEGTKKIHGGFIRAPQILEVGPKATLLASYNSQPVIVQQGRAIGCTFHPEIFYDLTLHKYFLDLLKK